jgi:type IV pilus assembly protein PilW
LNPAAAIQVLADNVVSMKVQLGFDVGGDDIVDAWINPPAAAATWTNPLVPLPQVQTSALPIFVASPELHKVKSIRIGLLVRSPQFERPDAAGNCTVSAAGPAEILPAVPGNAAQRLPDMPSAGTYTLAGDQRCFRYNTATTTVPLRNVLLSEM